MTEIIEIIIAIFIIIGVFLSLVSAFGVIRLPDVYTRNHAASKATTLGVMSILIGATIFFFVKDGYFNSRLVLGILFIFITAPVAGHLISRSAYHSGVKLWNKSVQDDLAKTRQKQKQKG
ncbi:monovalent cation/H(+) antiporter subunit G [Bacillus chungangensis]|uniref:Multicomponent Na+:H+ antiporter subunit G n=1 Tax=Bacillus chungangensis TaxID=587633 RepID=A0ABT9X0T4_9BACI|nr:monovalent cation/H(+) antiporter subunit G [Bacillus chungangensis]MDQ0178575.1 multicomponent Na+:H+ antiporter subunit G [Bacillus chungangensis]